MRRIYPRLHLELAVGLRHALAHLCRHVGGGVADVDLATGDIILASIQGNRLGKTGNRVLGGCIRSGIGPWTVRGNRAVIDNASPHGLLTLHQPERLLGAKEGAAQVDVDYGLPLLVAQAMVDDMQLLSRDSRLSLYEIKRIW